MMNQKDASLQVESGRNPSEAAVPRSWDRWQTAARTGWWILALVVLALTVANIPILYSFLSTVCPAGECPHQLTAIQIQQLENLGLSVSFYAVLFTSILTLVPFYYYFVAFLLYSRKSAGWIGLLGAYTLVLFGGITLPNSSNLIFPAHPTLPVLVLVLDYLGTLLFPLFIIVFPDGRIYPRWSIVFVAAWAILRIPSYLFSRGSFDFNTWPLLIQAPIWILLFGGMVLVQYYRFRRIYGPVLRQQTKWVVYGFMVAWGIHTAVRMVYLMIPREIQQAVLVMLSANALVYLVMALIPLSIALAIFHYRLWDIDLLINRTLVYIPLTGILGGLYTATVATFQKIFVATTGTTSDAAIIITTFIVAATFTPVKNGLQLAVDKRFKEPVDPLKEIDALDNQVLSVVEVLDPGLITSRLLNTSTHSLHACGGAVYLEQSGRMVLAQATPGWKDEDRKMSLPLECNGRQVGLLHLGARYGDGEYSPRECQALQQTANHVARVLAGFRMERGQEA